ncbi:hypothetical protein B5F17_10435 [Butyricicoccus pullicaecorum]|uniref:Type VII secretion system protein EssD-like domain-containing protein n=1 Tax=Butyricicoccus pullicaecorum TaxID=501571 RepID=A0A1Y4L5L6_9FIRM|nr:DNA/RNA non-specific endonuclease [Butyricicoccus pullicaecorum]OUP52057.1 hypothetical protein B5F17_10435 [Butyricicoccus pullicaecorum]
MKKRLFAVGLLLIMVLSGCAPTASNTAEVVALSDVPEFSGEPYVVINDNEPSFPAEDFTSEGFEEYSPLDDLGRCGVAYANVGLETMPTEERGSISNVKPTGWQSVQYDFVDGKSLYNRCHLIGFQLTGENANRQNLITGTRYMNVDGMLPFENLVADYVKETENHVLYRVTPIFEGDNLVASGVQMEAQSVEDKGEGVCFNVYVYNNQPGVTIDYATGDSWVSDEAPSDTSKESTYILNTSSSSKRFHNPDCSSVDSISPSNKKTYTGSRQELINQGYTPCGRCKP